MSEMGRGEVAVDVQKIGDDEAAYERQWMRENRPFGFEVQNIRLGGLRSRIEYAGRTIERYLSGALKTIGELEEPQKPFGYSPAQNEDDYQITRYIPAVTHGFL